MRVIIYSCLDGVETDYKDYLEGLLIEHAAYKANKDEKINILNDKEVEMIEFMIKSYENAQQMPTQAVLEIQFPEVVGAFNGIPKIALADFRSYINNFIKRRVNKEISKKILDVNKEIEKNGISDTLKERLDRLHKISSSHQVKKVNLQFDFKTYYEEKLNRPIGMLFNIETIDKKIGGCDPGTVTTLAAFTSQFKSTCAMNVAYHNAYKLGYNVVYLTLETPKEIMYTNLLSRHSYDPKFSKYQFIGQEKINHNELTPDEKDYLYDVVDADLSACFSDSHRGSVIFLDESDFDTFSFTEIYSVLQDIDEQLNGNLDAVIVDYVQLCKFSGMSSVDDNKMINSYITFFRRVAQNFDSVILGKKKLIMFLLAQVNRTNWLKATKREGRYDLTCLADANELERGSNRVITIFTTDSMKLSKEASMQILKNRNGRTMPDPEIVFVEPECYLFGEEQTAGFQSPSASVGGQDLGNLFGSDDLGGLI